MKSEDYDVVGVFDLTPNWRNLYRFLLQVKEQDPLAYRRLSQKYQTELNILELLEGSKNVTVRK